MEKEKVLTSLEEIKVFTDPFRMKILFALDEEPLTVKQLADRLGEVPSKVHYHVKELERIGVLEIVDKKEKAGIVEKYYFPTAERFRVEKVVAKEDGWKDQIENLRETMFKNASEDFKNYLTKRHDDDKEILNYGILNLTYEEFDELKKKLEELIERSSKRKNTKAYTYIIGVFKKYD
ncbi:helix-turn-helix domain-containing protein [Lutispora sp.]|uniref:helix-turn-helix domain-containing protein n=1 Tax=Lutispora sp. TaxID=2828727 RepID=UPI003566FD63